MLHHLTRNLRSRAIITAVLAVTPLTTAGAQNPTAQQEFEERDYVLESTPVDNQGAQFQTIAVGIVHIPDVTWLRVHFGDFDLGHASHLTLTALDGQEQRFDADSLSQWYDWSAIFNGDELEVTLHVAPGDTGVYVRIDTIRTSPQPLYQDPGMGSVASICNDFDDRISSNDPRVARMRGCTGWLVSNGAVLSAGHCPVAAGDVIEFSVPASLPNGATVAAAVNSQYPINIGTVMLENNGRGEDWMVYGLNPNSNTNLRAHNVQGFFFMTTATPAIDTTLRVTGYGLDNIGPGPGGSFCRGGTNNAGSCTTNANCPGGGTCLASPCCDSDGDGNCEFNCNATSQTQQSTIGPLDDLDGSIIEHDVDTMPANSGSPIIWDSTGEYTIGIHTQGGCDSFLDGYDNHGTRFNRGPLFAAVQNFLGPNSVYVDWADVGLPANGNVFEPFRTVSQAVAAVPNGGIIGLVPGFYPRSAGNTFVAGADGKKMTFISPVGSAVIGN